MLELAIWIVSKGEDSSLNLDTGIPDHPGGTPTSQQPEARLLEPLGKGQETGLVIDRQQS